MLQKLNTVITNVFKTNDLFFDQNISPVIRLDNSVANNNFRKIVFFLDQELKSFFKHEYIEE